MTYLVSDTSGPHYATTYEKNVRLVTVPSQAVLLYIKSYERSDWLGEWDNNGECYNYLRQDNIYDVFLYEEQLIQFSNEDTERFVFEIDMEEE